MKSFYQNQQISDEKKEETTAKVLEYLKKWYMIFIT
jgi:hypothetical protein